MSKIQRVELNTFYDATIHCPFCGQKVLSYSEDSGEEVSMCNPCPHTLFVAHDEGFEYRSRRFDENLGILGVENEDVLDRFDDNYDSLTDRVQLPDAVKFASYVGPPSSFGSYVGFAPLEAEDKP